MSGELVIPAEELQAPDGYSWRWHCTQKDAEIERLGKELESADRVANDWARQNVELRAENERLRDRVRRITEQRDTLLTGLDQKDDDIKRIRGLLHECLSFALGAQIGLSGDLWERVSGELGQALENRLSL